MENSLSLDDFITSHYLDKTHFHNIYLRNYSHIFKFIFEPCYNGNTHDHFISSHHSLFICYKHNDFYSIDHWSQEILFYNRTHNDHLYTLYQSFFLPISLFNSVSSFSSHNFLSHFYNKLISY
jgi:hypothetical protein